MLSDLKREVTGEVNFRNKPVNRKLKKGVYTAILILILALLVWGTKSLILNSSHPITPPKHTQLTFNGNVYFTQY